MLPPIKWLKTVRSNTNTRYESVLIVGLIIAPIIFLLAILLQLVREPLTNLLLPILSLYFSPDGIITPAGELRLISTTDFAIRMGLLIGVGGLFYCVFLRRISRRRIIFRNAVQSAGLLIYQETPD